MEKKYINGIAYELINGHTDFGRAKSGFLSGRARSSTIIEVKNHAINAHPERGFDAAEIVHLVRDGQIVDVLRNEMHKATPGSILVKLKDDLDDDCEFAVMVYYNSETGNYMAVLSAYRQDRS